MAVALCYKEVKAEMNKHFQLVAKEIGRDWTSLGRELNISDSDIDNIESDYRHTEDKAYQVLTKWYQKNGRARATREVLGKALQAVGKTSIAEEIGFPVIDDVKPIQEDSSGYKCPHQPTDWTDGKSTKSIQSKLPLDLASPNSFDLGKVLQEEAD